MSSSPTSSSSSDGPGPDPSREYQRLLDVPCPVAVLLGTGLISVRKCLELSRNSVLRLGQSAGEDLRVVINGVTIAKGEVVIIDDNAAIRLTEISPPSSETTR